MLSEILRKPQAVLELVMMLAVLAAMTAAPSFAPNDPDKVNIMQKFAEPSQQYPLGTDDEVSSHLPPSMRTAHPTKSTSWSTLPAQAPICSRAQMIPPPSINL